MGLLQVWISWFPLYSFVIKTFTFQGRMYLHDEWALEQSCGINNGYMFTFILILSPALTIMSINHNWLVAGCNQIYL